MTTGSSGITFSVPYEIAVARPLRQTSLSEREAALKAAGYNTELLPQELIYIDLKTDSGVSSLSASHPAGFTVDGPSEPGVGMAAAGSQAFGALFDRFRKTFGFPYMVPCNHGRAAERIWIKLHVEERSLVPGNMLSPSTRFFVESNGGQVIDVICDAAHDLDSGEHFKGNIDLDKLRALLKEHGAKKVACIYVELCVNACGGHPVSLGNLKEVKAVAAAHQVPLFLDAGRILENSYLIKQREPGYQSRSIQEIVHESCSLADGVTLSAAKDFLVPNCGLIGLRDSSSYKKACAQSLLDGSEPTSRAMEMTETALKEIFAGDAYVASRVEQIHYLWRRLRGGMPVLAPAGGHGVFIDARKFLPHVPSKDHPAGALAAFVYYVSGIRVTRSPPAPSQIARGIEFFRLAIPARRYLQAHLDDVAEAIFYAYAKRTEIKGLKQINQPSGSKYEPPLFAPL